MQYANHHDNQRSINQSINQLKRQKKQFKAKVNISFLKRNFHINK